MADTLTISIVDQSVAAENPVNIAVINQPNPVSGFTASAEQILDLLAFPKYFITDDGTGKPVNGDNFYEYFPDLDPSHGGGTGTDDYNQLSNKPSINSVTLSGNKTDEDLGIQNCVYDDQSDELYTMVDGVRVVLATDVKAEPLIPVMTSVNTPEGLVESGNNYGYGSYGNQNIWNAFDGDKTTYVTYQQEGVTNGFISYEFTTGNVRYVTKITALFGNYKATNSIPATLYVYDENDVETEVSTITVSGYAASAYGTFTFDVYKNVKKLKFVFGAKTNNTNIYTYDIQAYGWIVS